MSYQESLLGSRRQRVVQACISTALSATVAQVVHAPVAAVQADQVGARSETMIAMDTTTIEKDTQDEPHPLAVLALAARNVARTL